MNMDESEPSPRMHIDLTKTYHPLATRASQPSPQNQDLTKRNKMLLENVQTSLGNNNY